MVAVVTTDEFQGWATTLDKAERKALAHVIGLLEAKGVTLSHPHSSDIKGAPFALRELRINQSVIRVFYAFDPARQAVLLIGGSKQGQNEARFYTDHIRIAHEIWKRYLAGGAP
jgi:hypothetical protein